MGLPGQLGNDKTGSQYWYLTSLHWKKWAEESLEGGKTGGKLNIFIKRTETLEKLTHLHIKLPPSCQHVMLPFSLLPN